MADNKTGPWARLRNWAVGPNGSIVGDDQWGEGMPPAELHHYGVHDGCGCRKDVQRQRVQLTDQIAGEIDVDPTPTSTIADDDTIEWPALLAAQPADLPARDRDQIEHMRAVHREVGAAVRLTRFDVVAYEQRSAGGYGSVIRITLEDGRRWRAVFYPSRTPASASFDAYFDFDDLGDALAAVEAAAAESA